MDPHASVAAIRIKVIYFVLQVLSQHAHVSDLEKSYERVIVMQNIEYK